MQIDQRVRALTPTSQDLRRGAQYGDARAMISVLNLENDCQADSASRRLRWLSRWKETLDTASQCLRLGTGDRPDHALRESTRAQRFSGETAVGWSECANGATFRAGPKTRVPRPRLGATCTTYRYGLISVVIRSFADKRTADLFYGHSTARSRRVPTDVMRTALRKLAQLDAAARLEDLRVPPANRLEALAGQMRGLHSIRVNDQWRIVFRWRDDGPHEVAFTDYH